MTNEMINTYRRLHDKNGVITEIDIDKIPDNLLKERKPETISEIYDQYPISTFQDLDKLSKVYDEIKDLFLRDIEYYTKQGTKEGAAIANYLCFKLGDDMV